MNKYMKRLGRVGEPRVLRTEPCEERLASVLTHSTAVKFIVASGVEYTDILTGIPQVFYRGGQTIIGWGRT